MWLEDYEIQKELLEEKGLNEDELEEALDLWEYEKTYWDCHQTW